MKVVIVGGVAGGASAAARLRRLDEHAEIVLFEKDAYISFANCGLPYYIGDVITDKADLTLQTPESFFARFNVNVQILSQVIAIDKENKTVTVEKVETKETFVESYDKLILSPGATPFVPEIEGVEQEGIFSLRNIPDTYAIEDYIHDHNVTNAIVVGAGFIGVEMAENLHEKGLDVTLMEFADHILEIVDFELAAEVQQYMRKQGIDIVVQDCPQSITKKDGIFTVNTTKGKVYEAGIILFATGVRPESALAKDAGLELSECNAIAVNAHMQTSDPDVYAVGDAVAVTHFITGQTTMVPLAGPANHQGRIAANNIFGIPSRYGGTQGSSVLKVFDMAVATTGINETTAKALGYDYDKVLLYPASHATYYPGGTNMQLKVLFEKGSERILGGQIVGFDGVDKRCDVLATAIRFHATLRDLIELELCYAPPFSSAKDPVNMAGYIMENVADGKLNQIFWDDVESLPRDGSVTLLDVRTKEEYASGHIEGFKNIPVDSLRNHLEEIDKDKPVYMHCQVGLRSYIAYRILTGNGYRCYNLAGGYRLYAIASKEQGMQGIK